MNLFKYFVKKYVKVVYSAPFVGTELFMSLSYVLIYFVLDLLISACSIMAAALCSGSATCASADWSCVHVGLHPRYRMQTIVGNKKRMIGLGVPFSRCVECVTKLSQNCV